MWSHHVECPSKERRVVIEYNASHALSDALRAELKRTRQVCQPARNKGRLEQACDAHLELHAELEVCGIGIGKVSAQLFTMAHTRPTRTWPYRARPQVSTRLVHVVPCAKYSSAPSLNASRPATPTRRVASIDRRIAHLHRHADLNGIALLERVVGEVARADDLARVEVVDGRVQALEMDRHVGGRCVG